MHACTDVRLDQIKIKIQTGVVVCGEVRSSERHFIRKMAVM